jgi:multicomponent Na+:H+ antiporter subunit F
MMAIESVVVTATARIGLSILALSMMLVLYRIIRGPKNADRIIALDLLSVIVVALLALYAIFSGDAVFLDVVIAYALVAFLGTVAFARYIVRAAETAAKNSIHSPKGEDHD